ncbi:MAG: carbon-phosphorus lyase complex subunit PhnI [Deltaproteobacteria bacterium]|jgi:alpha-D-ribose 1-methylphosphonate 5-triphosphate synthase subunit PhnI|nr:carbon-phosphorus lyase complex subunit PhnI [Deltaproteobacteria bacterium]
MYVAVKGGQKAISEAHKLLDETRRGDPSVPELSLEQIKSQLSLSVDRVQAEGSLYAPNLAALAVKQAKGDLVEAIFLLRAARASLKRFGYSEPVETAAMRPERRVSATFKDIPGGQILGPTFDYTHRLLKRSLMDHDHGLETYGSGTPSFYPQASEPKGYDQTEPPAGKPTSQAIGRATSRAASRQNGEGIRNFVQGPSPNPTDEEAPSVSPQAPPRAGELIGAATFLEREGMLESVESQSDERESFDITRQPLEVPLGRSGRLQSLARADEGFLLALAYSSQRGFGSVHPFVAELRLGPVEVEFMAPEIGLAITIGEIEVTECQTANQFKGGGGKPPMFTRGYGLTFGHNERKALSMAIVDRALRSRELGEAIKGPAQNEEFVLYHGDNVEASGFVSHIKLPHYVDFQAELSMLREMRQKFDQDRETPEDQK